MMNYTPLSSHAGFMKKPKMNSLPRRDVPSKGSHTKEQWEAVKETFHKLYIDQGKSLDDTIADMKNEFAFAATRRQWERRMKAWGFSKYVRADARQQFLQEALAAGMTEEQLLNAQNIPVDDSGGDDTAQRRNWRRFVKRQNINRSRSAHTSPAATTNAMSRQVHSLSVPETAMSELSSSSVWTSPVVPEISVSLWDDTVGQKRLVPQRTEQGHWSPGFDGLHFESDPDPYASDFSFRMTDGYSESALSQSQSPSAAALNNHIRLVNVNPGVRDSEISVERVDSNVNATYEALSYCWGSPDVSKSILVNGTRLTIRKNLYDALKALRYRDRTRTIWIDALCINQNDIAEKKEQIAKMASIYSNAKQVCVWLGEDTSSNCQARDFISSIADLEALDKMLEDFSPTASWEAFSELTRRTYWTRTWVLQEVLLATKVVVYWGKQQSVWADFVDALSLFINLSEQLPKSWRVSSRFKDRFRAISQPEVSGAQRFIEMMHQVVRKAADGKPKDYLQPLHRLPIVTRSLACADPRDRIFAILSLANDAAPASIIPDYSMPLLQVYRSFLQLYLQRSESLDILCLPWADGDDMPSWIGKVNNETFQVTPTGEYRRVHADSLTWNSHFANIYSASANWKAKYHFESTKERSLFIEGLEVGRITVTASIARAGCVPADWLTRSRWQDRRKPPPETFWHTLVAGRSLEGTEPPPAFYARACQWAFDHTVAKDDLNTEEMISSPYTPSTVKTFLQRVQAVVWKRCLIRTYSGHIGLAPEGTTSRDIIVIFFGCSVPLVLREAELAQQSYKLVGECYIHGLMNGEALRNYASAPPKIFELI